MNQKKRLVISTTVARWIVFLVSLGGVALLWSWFLPSPVNAQEPQGTTISGKVVNGTEGGSVPDNFQVILLTADEESGQVIETASTRVDRDGSFIFENVLRSPGISYRIVADYHDVAHVGYIGQESELTGVELAIYELTPSPGDLILESYDLYVPVIEPQSRTMGFLGSVAIRNDGDRVYMPDPTAPSADGNILLQFSAPEGFADLSVKTSLPQGTIVTTDKGWASTNPVPPGTHLLQFTYTAEYEGNNLEFDLNLPYGLESLRVFLLDESGNVLLDGAATDDLAVMGDSTYVTIERTGYEPGESAHVLFDNLPAPSLIQSISNALSGKTYITVIVWLAAAGIGVMLVYVFFVQRRKNRAASEVGETIQAVNEEDRHED